MVLSAVITMVSCAVAVLWRSKRKCSYDAVLYILQVLPQMKHDMHWRRTYL